MAAISFGTGLLLVLLISSVASGDSMAGASRVAEIGGLATYRFPDGGVEHHADSTVAWNKVLRGRKMGVLDGTAEKGGVMEVMNGAKKPGANTSVGTCNHHGEGEPTVACGVISDHRGVSSGGNLVDFVPFSSDYRGAKETCSEVPSRISWGRSYISMDNQDNIAYMETRRGLLRLRLTNTQEQHGSQAVLSRSVEQYSPTHPSLEPETHDNLLDAATEISTMLSKDYGHKPRSRNPVHNQQHLDHKNAETRS